MQIILGCKALLQPLLRGPRKRLLAALAGCCIALRPHPRRVQTHTSKKTLQHPQVPPSRLPCWTTWCTPRAAAASLLRTTTSCRRRPRLGECIAPSSLLRLLQRLILLHKGYAASWRCLVKSASAAPQQALPPASSNVLLLTRRSEPAESAAAPCHMASVVTHSPAHPPPHSLVTRRSEPAESAAAPCHMACAVAGDTGEGDASPGDAAGDAAQEVTFLYQLTQGEMRQGGRMGGNILHVPDCDISL